MSSKGYLPVQFQSHPMDREEFEMLLLWAAFKPIFPLSFPLSFTYGLCQTLRLLRLKEPLTLPAFLPMSPSLLIARSNFLAVLIQMLVRPSTEFLNVAENCSLFDGFFFFFLLLQWLISALNEWQSQHKVEGGCAASSRERRARPEERAGSSPFSIGELHMSQGIIPWHFI